MNRLRSVVFAQNVRYDTPLPSGQVVNLQLMGGPTRKLLNQWCPGRDLNPHSPCGEKDFKVNAPKIQNSVQRHKVTLNPRLIRGIGV